MEHEAQCGSLRRPLDPAAPGGVQIDVHVAVLPALARHKRPDPLVFLAGGPGQSAIELAGTIAATFSRVATRRDIVLVDQRGTGRSAPLKCPAQPPALSLAERVDAQAARGRLASCLQALKELPHGDLRHYTTPVAMADLDAVRQALGATQWNVVGVSYGTRAALEYARQFPQAVRRLVLDGVAPPDMALPWSFGVDAQAAFEQVLQACEREPRCAQRHPALRQDWSSLLASLPRTATVAHPVHGREESLTFTREAVASLVRTPLYVPALASVLPHAIAEAARGRFAPLVGLAGAVGSGSLQLAEGQHYSVICNEDWPRAQAQAQAAASGPASVFGPALLQTYRDACALWPRAVLPAGFDTLAPARAPTLVLSGGADPVTPPRHGERVVQALGRQARHVVVPEAGHGLLGIGCVRDAVARFIQAEDDAAAQTLSLDCARAVPRPLAWQPVGLPAEGSSR